MNEQQRQLVWTSEEVITVIRSLAREEDLPAHLVEGAISVNDTVDSLGIDSLGGVYLIERFEQMTGVLMPDDFLDLDFTIAEIADRLNRLDLNGKQK